MISLYLFISSTRVDTLFSNSAVGGFKATHSQKLSRPQSEPAECSRVSMDVYGLGGVYRFGNAKKNTSTSIHRFHVVVVCTSNISCVNALSVRCIPHLGTCHTLHPVQKVTCKQDSADLVTRTLGSTMAVIVSCTKSHKRST